MRCATHVRRCSQLLHRWKHVVVRHLGHEMNELFKDTGFNFDAFVERSQSSMRGMFQSARSFNQIIDAWDVSSVTSFKEMFYEAVAFANRSALEHSVRERRLSHVSPRTSRRSINRSLLEHGVRDDDAKNV